MTLNLSVMEGNIEFIREINEIQAKMQIFIKSGQLTACIKSYLKNKRNFRIIFNFPFCTIETRNFT